jgi:hypothetical protein
MSQLVQLYIFNTLLVVSYRTCHATGLDGAAAQEEIFLAT